MGVLMVHYSVLCLYFSNMFCEKQVKVHCFGLLFDLISISKIYIDRGQFVTLYFSFAMMQRPVFTAKVSFQKELYL